MTSAPWLPPVIRIWNGSAGARGGMAKNSGAHGNSRECRLASPKLRRRLVGRGDAGHHARQHAVCESRLGVRLEHDGGQSAQYGGKHHRPGGVSPDSQRGGKLVPVKDRERVPHRGSELRDIPDKFHPANALEARGANRLKRKPRLGYQAGFNSALGSDEHYFSFLSPRYPFPGDGQRGKNVPACAASRNQQLQISLPRFRHMALPGCGLYLEPAE